MSIVTYSISYVMWWKLVELLYRHSCPVCGGIASSRELIELNSCSRCAFEGRRNRVEEIAVELWMREVNDLVKFFTDTIDHEPWSLQIHWIKRLLSGESFAMIAPTGIGKSTLLAIYALYRAHFYKWKIYILTPTREIAKQFYNRMREYLEKLVEKGYPISDIRIVFYDSSSRHSKNLKEDIRNGNFDILITSASFLSRNYDIVSINKIDLIVADDLDALMKNSKNIDRILRLLGFTDEEIELALKLVKLKQNLTIAKLSNTPEKVENLRLEVLELEAQLRNRIAMRKSQLVVASATGRVKGLKPLIMKELLGFEGGALFEYWRNVEDYYAPLDKALHILPKVVKKLGSGIIFISQGIDKEFVERIREVLEHNGIKVAIAKSGTKAVDRFRRGEVDVVIGTSSYYGILVRGLDEPLRVRFTVFIGTPRIVRDLKLSLYNIRFLYVVLRELKNRGIDVIDSIKYLVEVIQRSTHAMLIAYSKWMKDPDSAPNELKDRINNLIAIAEDAYKKLRDIVRREKMVIIGGTAIIVEKQNRTVVIRPDPYTYIQASGRSSRLLNGTKTFGVSIVFEEYHELIKMLELRLKRFVTDIEFKKFVDHYLDFLAKRVEVTRRSSAIGKDIRNSIKTALIVVESPTKAKTIANMFGKPARRVVGESLVYETVIPVDEDNVYVATIAASLGHITDLVTDEGIYGVKIVGNK
ncbi:MAG TPA: reverse gyrase, partial [Ignisphaera sp.]|nr:reverse gyrase [Ignisphaera sp.]